MAEAVIRPLSPNLWAYNCTGFFTGGSFAVPAALQPADEEDEAPGYPSTP